MKRYRIFPGDFDTRPALLGMEINPTWEHDIQEQYQKDQQRIVEGLLQEYGTINGEAKVKNFIDFGNKPLSVLAFHNRFLEQIRDAFVIGAYYPALTGACALGERILNHLILKLREFYKNTPEYKKVYSKNSFDDWVNAINILETWDVLLPEVILKYKKLSEIRNKKAIHFNPETDINDREIALEAIKLLNEIVGDQFSGFGPQPWFITDVPGESYIKKIWETKPFVTTIYLPNGLLVGPYHHVADYDFRIGAFLIHDEDDYTDLHISDEEFGKLRKQGRVGKK